MSERVLQDAVAGLARVLGWRVAHVRPLRRQDGTWRTPWQYDGKGLPDIIAVRERVLFAELKSGRNRLSPEQRNWLDALRAAGAEAHVWREEEWVAGVVEAELRRVAA